MRAGDRIALVTGSSRGIGRAIALELAGAGADVVVTYRERRQAADEVAAKARAAGVRAIAVQLDVSSRASIRSAIEAAMAEFGRIDVLVNNAGILEQKPFATVSDDDWDSMMAVNLRGPFACAQELLPGMKQRGFGRIVNLASSGGQVGGTLAVHYATSKAGIIGLTRSLARLGAPEVLVNCVAPGLIESEMTAAEIASEVGKEKIRALPVGRPGLAEEVARAVAFLASDAASYITGQTINVNGGQYLG
jgi:acetoacetyl-CoA reductase/3-oxoacyl-[acyl-carrier protein] reductase